MAAGGAAFVAAALLLAAGTANACELSLAEQRSGRELLRAPLPAATLRVAFTHSVLGTPVEDRYVWRDAGWHLVEERFEGEGYGLPHAAGAGERLERDGSAWRLRLDRAVQPLLIRAPAVAQMRLVLDDGRSWPLTGLAHGAIDVRALSC
ncbi:MAG: DUF1850 domain-containing protein [Burkholderiaceae bacterium]